MYKAFYKLARNPFDLTPDPSYFVSTTRHNEALAALHYGIRKHKGFVVVTGEVGTGKTLLLRCLLRLLKESKDVVYAYLFNSRLSPTEFLQYILSDFGLPTSGKNKGELLLELGQFVVSRGAKGLTTVLIVDEAHHMTADLLEEVRLLSNLETVDDKLLQIVLVGQSELDEALDSVGLRQLKQRIAVRARLTPLSTDETAEYIEHRLQVAGLQAPVETLFPPETIAAVYYHSHGVPRLINTLCENSLITAYARQMPVITAEVVDDVAREFHLETTLLPGAEGGVGEVDREKATQVLRDLYSVLRRTGARGAEAAVPIGIEASEYEPNL